MLCWNCKNDMGYMTIAEFLYCSKRGMVNCTGIDEESDCEYFEPMAVEGEE